LANKLTELLAEAKRRRVFRTAGVYLVAVFGISANGVDVASLFGISQDVLRVLVIGAVAFLPVVVILAWMFDIGRSGIVRDRRNEEAPERSDDEIASMSTMIDGELGVGGVIVRWNDANGENGMLYVDEFYLGRGTDCRVRFYDPLVSRRHARVFHDDGIWYIEDLGSRNGTRVGDELIQRIVLEESNRVRLNELGPSLRIDLIRSGAATRKALAEFPPGQPTAHVRMPTSDLESSSRPATG
jgi:hypothetical protein